MHFLCVWNEVHFSKRAVDFGMHLRTPEEKAEEGAVLLLVRGLAAHFPLL